MQVEFGSIFDGETRSKTLFILNNAPTPLKFHIDLGSAATMAARPMSESEADGSTTDSNPYAGFVTAARARAQAISSAASDPFEISPRSGEIGAFQKAHVLVEYAPRSPAPSQGFVNTASTEPRIHKFTAAFEFGGDARQPRLVPLSGTAHAAAASITPQTLQFGDVECYGHRHMNTEIKNLTTDQVVSYRSRASVPHFSVEPPEAVIAPLATQFLAVIFHPKSLGRFQGNLVLELVTSSGRVIGEQHIAVVATSNLVGAKQKRPGGLDALPEDFKLEERYVSQAEIARGMAGKPAKFVRPSVRSSRHA